MNPATQTDFYKTGHYKQYPENTQLVYSNMTPRSDRLFKWEDFDGKIVFFGLQAFIKEYLIEEWNTKFFGKSKEQVCKYYKRRMDTSLGQDAVSVSQLEELHALGYLPIEIRALPEGTKVPIGVPVFTIHNTLPEFYWLTNFLETVMSCELWKPSTVATIAHQYKKMLDEYAEKTGGDKGFVALQGHDFSFRGMSGRHDAAMSGMGHLISFVGTDTIPAIDAAEEFYSADAEKELLGTSVPACYDTETEILTENGFIKFSDLLHGVKVAQYHKDRTVDFVEPTEYYVFPYSGEMVHWTNDGVNSVDILVTPNHKMVRIKEDKNTIELFEAGDTSYRNRKGYSHRHYLPISGTTKNNNAEGMTAIEKLQVAFQADGAFPSRPEAYKAGQIRFSFKKERKKERLVSLLDAANLEYSMSEKDSRGYYSFWINPEGTTIFNKDFSWVTLDKSLNWYEDFISELSHWDGCIKNNCVIYSNTDKSCVDKVQQICAITGYSCSVSEYLDKRGDRRVIYSACIADREMLHGNAINRTFVTYTGEVYCVSVPTKMLIVRRNGKVSVCGNTEHSVMCMGGKETEIETFRRLIEDVYPSGIVSIVSDTWNFWNVVGRGGILEQLKDKVMARQPDALGLNKVVVRPDSGDPVKIICGYEVHEDFAFSMDQAYKDENGDIYKVEGWTRKEKLSEPEIKGAIECLWDIFGGTINDKGYKVLDEHIGLIYGDSITLDRAKAILEGLEAKGFCSTNVVFGIGSYTYQYITRDTFGWAIKATAGNINGQNIAIQKDPITDKGSKKSASGFLVVDKTNEGYRLSQNCTPEDAANAGELKRVFFNGSLLKEWTFQQVRQNLLESK